MKVAVRGTDGVKIVHTLDGDLDEVAVDPWLHVEQLDDDAWYLRVGDARIGVMLEPDGSVNVDVERGFYAAVCGRTSGQEQRHPAQSSVAPDGSPSVAPEAGAPSSAPRVNAGIGQEADAKDPGKDGQ